jgi:hyaluronoglucosaminidase
MYLFKGMRFIGFQQFPKTSEREVSMKGKKNPTPDFIRGVVEGFYGVFYTFPERIDLIRFIGKHGFNLYVYAPKNDRQQRARWWEPYPKAVMAQFTETIQAARRAGVRFCYAISPGGSIRYSSAQDFSRLTGKLNDLYQAGTRAFSLMLDDNEPGFRHTEDERCFKTLAHAQADLANRLFAWLHALDETCTLSLVPSDYCGRAPFCKELVGLASRLHPDIDLCYTGPEICSTEISAEDARSFASATGRKPLIWDNFPANDLALQPELHIGAVTGRAADLLGEVKGFLVNPMIQAEASKIALLTFAAYWADPVHYDPSAAWQSAVCEVAGEAYSQAMRTLAENVSGASQGRKLDQLARTALASLRVGYLDAPEICDLETYLAQIDEAGYALKFRLENLALRSNLLPWIEVLEDWMWMGRYTLRVLSAIKKEEPYLKDLNRIYEYRTATHNHPKRIASRALNEIVDFTLTQVIQDQRQRLTTVTVAGRLS